MNKVLLAVGLLSTGLAVGQNQTTNPSSTTTSTSNYNTSNTNNENSRNATLQTNSSTDRPMSTTGSSYNRSNSSTGMSTSGANSNSSTSGSYNSMGTGTMGSNSGSSTSGSYNSNSGYGTTTTTPSTSGSYNSNSMNNGSTTTPSTNGSYNTNSIGTGTSATTPSTSDYNSTGTTVTTNSTYSTNATARPMQTKDYKNFAYGIYVGVNTTKFKGEALDANGSATALTGRLGYQAGFFVRGGGRLYGQLGAEYFASSSNYFTAGQGQSAASIRDQINIKYIQIPVYIGYKLTESDRGISAVRVQIGAEYANQIGSTANQFGNLNDFQVKSGTFNGLGQIGLDAGPVFLDLTYHYGFSNAIQQNTGFAGSQRRILSASLGFKF